MIIINSGNIKTKELEKILPLCKFANVRIARPDIENGTLLGYEIEDRVVPEGESYNSYNRHCFENVPIEELENLN